MYVLILITKLLNDCCSLDLLHMIEMGHDFLLQYTRTKEHQPRSWRNFPRVTIYPRTLPSQTISIWTALDLDPGVAVCRQDWYGVAVCNLHTRNTHVHLCLTPVCRLCTHVQVRRAWHVLRLLQASLGEAIWCQQYPSRDGPAAPSPNSISIAKERCRLPIYLSRAYNVSECVRLCNHYAYMAYTYGM